MGDRQRKRKHQESLAPDSKMLKDNVSAWKYLDFSFVTRRRITVTLIMIYLHVSTNHDF